MRANEYPARRSRARVAIATCRGTGGYSGVPDPIRVFVNEHPVTVAPGAPALDAARAHDPALAERIAAGAAALTDARGLPVDPAEPLAAGAILRVVSRRTEPDADA
jgi:hypothetical protein